MDTQEETVLTGARHAWPSAVSISNFRLRQVADKLVRRELLTKGKFSGGVLAYQITDKGKAAIAPVLNAEYEREVARAQEILRQSLGLKREKPPTRR